MIVVDSKSSSRVVTSHIMVSKDLKKYFKCFSFFSKYDEEIQNSDSIINIPVLSIVLPFAWITGSDVYVDELDKTFTEAMFLVQNEYKKVYPKAPFKTKLVVNTLIENDYTSDETGLLFSGGLDSTYSLFSNIALNPRLIMLFGTDIPLSNIPFQDNVKTEYSNFAEREGLKINFVYTNALEILNHGRLNHLWWNYQGRHEGDFWNGIGYSLGHIGQVAPLSIGRFKQLFFAATRTVSEKRKYPDASLIDTDEKIAWANLHVRHDGCLQRHEKVLWLRKLLMNKRIKLRVCWSDPKYLLHKGVMNCNQCEKCLRTIASLAIAKVDLGRCGFRIDDLTFNLIRFLFEHKLLTKAHLEKWWKPLQKMIPNKIEGDIHGSQKLFRWFKSKDLDLVAKPYYTKKSILYNRFPYSILQLISGSKISNILKKTFFNSPAEKFPIYRPLEPLRANRLMINEVE